MSFWSGLFGGGATPVIDATGTAVEKTGKALDSLFTSDDERLSHAEIMEKIKQQPDEWAHQLNLINANDSSWFNSGWRPALGWVGALGMFFYFVPQYALGAFLWVNHCLSTGTIAPYPVSDAGLWELVAMLLGAGTLRTAEKKMGVAAK